ncbi:hypothetical protein GIB67_000383, partial [Kingdonia uniflora]
NRDSMRVHGTFTSVFKVWKDIATLPAYWFYEYCGVGHPIVKEEVKYPAYPRLRAWEKGNKRKTNDQAANLFIIGKYHIDHRTVETITWEPWFDSAVSETEDVLNAKLISRKRIPLQIPNGNCEYYLGDRCWSRVCSGRTEDPGGGGRACYCPQATLHQLYAHDLQLRRGRDVRVVPLPPGGDTRTRQRGSGPRTRGGSTSRRGRGTGDDSE